MSRLKEKDTELLLGGQTIDLSSNEYSYLGGEFLDNVDDFVEVLIYDTNKNFLESLRFNNIYNRLVTYSGKDYHKCNSFYSGKNERLTLVFFVKKIQVNRHPPLQRSKVHLIKFK